MTLLEACQKAKELFPALTVHAQKQVTLCNPGDNRESYVMSVIPGFHGSGCDAVSCASLEICLESLKELVKPPAPNLE